MAKFITLILILAALLNLFLMLCFRTNFTYYGLFHDYVISSRCYQTNSRYNVVYFKVLLFYFVKRSNVPQGSVFRSLLNKKVLFILYVILLNFPVIFFLIETWKFLSHQLRRGFFFALMCITFLTDTFIERSVRVGFLLPCFGDRGLNAVCRRAIPRFPCFTLVLQGQLRYSIIK